MPAFRRHVDLLTPQTIGGAKTFTSDPIVPDEAYHATNWDNVLEPPTKNAIRDKIESLISGAVVEVLARTSVGTGASYQMTNITGYRQLVFIFEELSLNSTPNILFQVGVAGPTYRTTSYVGWASGVGGLTTALSLAQVASSAHLVKNWVINVYNPDDSGEYTYGESILYLDIATDRVEHQVCRYGGGLEAHPNFRLITSTGGSALDGGFATILGIP